MRSTMLIALVMLSMFTMGASSCQNEALDVVGVWNADCTYTNPSSKVAYIWEFQAPTGQSNNVFRSWKKVKTGDIDDEYTSFYMYERQVLTVSYPFEQNNDKIYYVTSTPNGVLSLTGGEYKCVLTPGEIPTPETQN
ncbi:MAG TPA: hypothetical protein VFV50_15590 [Bdellovibrionales bacterium]|nr:hypothetical protein [Bdellovibrionales bacterium]